jgi:CHAD domain-containing protein
LKKKESAGQGLRRVAKMEIEEALDLAERKGGDPDEKVHELRKHLKKFRAVVRLARDELGEKVYRRENDSARDLGRRLAPVRDSDVLVQALDGLKKEYEDDFEWDRARAIRSRLAGRQRAAVARLKRGRALSTIAKELETLRRRTRKWALRREGYDGVESGVRRAYRRGREGEATAFDSREDADFHEWRKRAKDLRYHVELLAPVWPEGMRAEETTLHDLTDALGDDHDLAELRRMLMTARTLARSRKDSAAAAALVEMIDRRRAELQSQARPLGDRVYAEKPRDFSRRIESYWAAWKG